MQSFISFKHLIYTVLSMHIISASYYVPLIIGHLIICIQLYVFNSIQLFLCIVFCFGKSTIVETCCTLPSPNEGTTKKIKIVKSRTAFIDIS